MNSPVEQSAKALMNDSEKVMRDAEKIKQRAQMLLADMEQQMETINAAQPGQGWMNKTQAGRYLGVSYRSVLRYEKDGKLGFNGSGRIHRSELDGFMRDYKASRARHLGLLNGRSK